MAAGLVGQIGTGALRSLDGAWTQRIVAVGWLLVGAAAAMVLGGAAAMRELFGTSPDVDWGFVALGGAQFAGIQTVGLLVFALALARAAGSRGGGAARSLLGAIAGVAVVVTLAAAYATEELVRRAPDQWQAEPGLPFGPPSAQARAVIRVGTAAPYWVATVLAALVAWQAIVMWRRGADLGGR